MIDLQVRVLNCGKAQPMVRKELDYRGREKALHTSKHWRWSQVLIGSTSYSVLLFSVLLHFTSSRLFLREYSWDLWRCSTRCKNNADFVIHPACRNVLVVRICERARGFSPVKTSIPSWSPRIVRLKSRRSIASRIAASIMISIISSPIILITVLIMLNWRFTVTLFINSSSSSQVLSSNVH